MPDDFQTSDLQLEVPADLDMGGSDMETLKPVQFPLSVFFELTGIVALIFITVDVTGSLSAIELTAMAIFILLRQGVAALVCFAMALLTVDMTGAGFFVCVGLGGAIASWPIARSAILGGLGFRNIRA